MRSNPFKPFASAAVRTGTRVGLLKRDDPRARAARVELNGVDITRGYQPPGYVQRYAIHAAHDREGWIAYIGPDTPSGLMQGLRIVRGDVRIYLNTPSDDAMTAMQMKPGMPS